MVFLVFSFLPINKYDKEICFHNFTYSVLYFPALILPELLKCHLVLLHINISKDRFVTTSVVSKKGHKHRRRLGCNVMRSRYIGCTLIEPRIFQIAALAL
jgi:hypothetical protein